MKQKTFEKLNKYQLSHGGLLRQKRSGRGVRAISCKEPLHVVFKINQKSLTQLSLRSFQTHRLVDLLIKAYAVKFFIKIEQISIQNDHIHLLMRSSKRSLIHHFFRVLAGQISQRLRQQGLLKEVTDTFKNKTKLWKYRPFSKVIRGYKTYKIVRDYIQLNIKEALGEIKYNSKRLKGLSITEWDILWR